MKKRIIYLCMCLGLLGMFSCVNDNPIILEGNGGSKLEIGENYKISTFTLPHKGNLLNKDVKKLVIVLHSLGEENAEDIELDSEVTVGDDILQFSVKIPKDLTLKDGVYKLWLRLLDNTKLARFFQVRFEKEMLYLLSSQGYEYSFSQTAAKGEDGTKLKPYTINNQADFSTLLMALTSDSTAARGLYFKQTSDFIAPNVSMVVDGLQYYGEAFAGTYDAGGHEISYVYTGQNDSEKGSYVGLFTRLKDGATVKNLVLFAKVTGGYSKVGGLAGEASGTITLDSVEVKGDIVASNEYVGGLIGYMKTGVLTVNNCVLDMAVMAGARFAGGLAGGADDCTVNVNGLKTKNADNENNPTAFIVTAGNYAGGLIGTLGNTAFNIENVNLKHTVDGETSEVKVVTSEGTGSGGLFGQSVRQLADCSLKKVKIQCPVRVTGSGKYCGGLIGYIKLNKNLTIVRNQSTSVVYGDEAVGGMIGEVNMENGGSLSLGDSIIKSHVCVSGSAVSSVKGRETVGGFIGAFKFGSLTIKNINIATNVFGTENNVGGLIGYLESADVKVEATTILDENMMVEGKESVGGLFGCANKTLLQGPSDNIVNFNDGVVPNMDIFKDQFSGKLYGNSNVGGILGQIKGQNAEMRNFSAYCSISTLGNSSGTRMGGILGAYENSGVLSVNNCVFKGVLNSNGGDMVGGIVGYCDVFSDVAVDGKIEKCLNWGEVTGGNATSGILGYIRYGRSNGNWKTFHVTDCVNALKTNSNGVRGQGNVGGIIGETKRGDSGPGGLTVERCGNFAPVSSESGSGAVGGIVGRFYGAMGYVKYSSNCSSVKGNGEYLGGIVGKFGYDPEALYPGELNGYITSCSNSGEISGEAKYIGGIVGYLEEGDSGDGEESTSEKSAVFDCYNAGAILNSSAGGIVGFADADSNVYRNLNYGHIGDGNGAGIIADGDFGPFKRDPQCYANYYVKGYSKAGKTGVELSVSAAKESSSYHSHITSSGVWIFSVYRFPILKNCPFQ